MSRTNPLTGVAYHISRNYSLVTVWTFNTQTLARTSVARCRPSAGQSRQMRFAIVCNALKAYGIEPPQFVDPKTSKSRET